MEFLWEKLKIVLPVFVFMAVLMTIAGFGTRIYFQSITYAKTTRECKKQTECVAGVKKYFAECFASASRKVTAKRLILGVASKNSNPLFELDRENYQTCLNTKLGKTYFTPSATAQVEPTPAPPPAQ